jgi:Ca2+/H+ antiporter, TMEM165/GDT1 family
MAPVRVERLSFPLSPSLNAIVSSFALVFVGEMGDKTQLLAFSLASRFHSPWKIIGGLLLATTLNHLLAAMFGSWITEQVPHHLMHWILGVTFIAFGLWTLKPDELEDGKKKSWGGVFVTTFILFFLVEMGDKTQLATAALAAKFDSILLVTIGTTTAMTLVDGVAILVGKKLAERLPLAWIRRGAAVLFVAFGIWSLIES